MINRVSFLSFVWFALRFKSIYYRYFRVSSLSENKSHKNWSHYYLFYRSFTCWCWWNDFMLYRKQWKWISEGLNLPLIRSVFLVILFRCVCFFYVLGVVSCHFEIVNLFITFNFIFYIWILANFIAHWQNQSQSMRYYGIPYFAIIHCRNIFFTITIVKSGLQIFR